MILGVGLVSLATLFPIGLLRLRDAARWSRSATLLQTAASDAIARGLLGSQSFQYADQLNYEFQNLGYAVNPWYSTATSQYNPLIQDTPFYGGDWLQRLRGRGGPGNPAPHPDEPPGQCLCRSPRPRAPVRLRPAVAIPDHQSGQYVRQRDSQSGRRVLPVRSGAFEARFGSGLTTIRPDPFDHGLPSAHGLQRLTNFNRPFFAPNGGAQTPIMPASVFVPNIFVSQEDVVWQQTDNHASAYTLQGARGRQHHQRRQPGHPRPESCQREPVARLSVHLDVHGPADQRRQRLDLRRQHRDLREPAVRHLHAANAPFPQGSRPQTYQVDGETVVEAIFGHGNMVIGQNQPFGYGANADRTVLLRWPIGMPDPVVRPGDWIADVTYERNQQVVNSRWWQNQTNPNGQPVPFGAANPANNNEWDNLPAQRCYWYHVQKVLPPATDIYLNQAPGYRSMVVYVNQSLQSRTPLTATGTPLYLNAALIAPNVVNVIPQTIFAR